MNRNTYIKVKTESNFRGANDRELKVEGFYGTIIAAFVPEFGWNENGEPQGELRTCDFNIKEVWWIKTRII